MMNEFGFIDYKKPLGMEDDMRTSTYRGHLYMTDTRLGNEMVAKFKEHKGYVEDAVLEENRVSDYKANYKWQYGDPDELRNPSLGPKVHFMKNFEDIRLRFIKRPLRPASSVSHQDYLWQPRPEPAAPTPLALPTPVQTTQIVIDRSKPGYAKLLDPAATTSRLAFVHYTPQQIMQGIGAKDNITYWNWNEKSHPSKRVFPGRDHTMCDDKASHECTKRRCEFPSQLKHVPHTGLTTEVRQNYLEPYKHGVEVDLTDVRNTLVHFPMVPFSKNTEYKLYGSGERTQKYV